LAAATRHLTDLVEEQGAAVGFLEETAAVFDRTGESAALVPEQLALEEMLGQRSGIDGDERTVAQRPVAMQGTRDELLARAGLALQENVDGGAGDFSRVSKSRCIAALSPRMLAKR
jgi:hypothetical protein